MTEIIIHMKNGEKIVTLEQDGENRTWWEETIDPTSTKKPATISITGKDKNDYIIPFESISHISIGVSQETRQEIANQVVIDLKLQEASRIVNNR